MVLGSDGLGLIEFDDVELTRTIGIIAIVLILFEGGLTAGWGEIRPVLGVGVSLATVGTLITAAITGLAAAWLLDFSPLEGLLLGSIVATTDSAAIFSVLRASSLKRKLARTLEAESGLNDPVAILLVIGFIELIQTPGYGVLNLVVLVITQLAIGAAVGVALGRASAAALRRVGFSTSGLYPVATIAAAALAYGAADFLEGSGFLAVYLTGLALGSARTPARRTIEDFHGGVAWVAQITLFLTLGLLVFPSRLVDIALEGLLLAAVMAIVARPVAAIVATTPFGFALRESVLVGWAGLRGALPVVFATFPVLAGVPGGGPLLQHRLLHRARLHAPPGSDLRAAGTSAPPDRQPARPPPPAARRGRHDPPARRGGAGVPRRRGRRYRRPARERARPAAGGARAA